MIHCCTSHPEYFTLITVRKLVLLEHLQCFPGTKEPYMVHTLGTIMFPPLLTEILLHIWKEFTCCTDHNDGHGCQQNQETGTSTLLPGLEDCGHTIP